MGCRFRFLLLYKLQYDSAAYTNNSTTLSKQSCSCSIFNFATLYHLFYSGVYINNTFQIFIEDEKYINTISCSTTFQQAAPRSLLPSTRSSHPEETAHSSIRRKLGFMNIHINYAHTKMGNTTV